MLSIVLLGACTTKSGVIPDGPDRYMVIVSGKTRPLTAADRTMRHTLEALFWMFAGYLLFPPLVKFVKDWWGLRQVEKQIGSAAKFDARKK